MDDDNTNIPKNNGFWVSLANLIPKTIKAVAKAFPTNDAIKANVILDAMGLLSLFLILAYLLEFKELLVHTALWLGFTSFILLLAFSFWCAKTHKIIKTP